MTISVRIVGKDGRPLAVNSEGEFQAVVHPHPPRDEGVPALPFRQYFTDDGTATGTSDMRVNGATTSVNYWISADEDKDIYIRTLSVLIADASASASKFGNLTALTNGIVFKWSSQSEGDVIIHEGITSNFDFMRLAGQPAFGDGTTAGQIGNAVGTSEGYIPFIDLAVIFGLQYGIRLRAGTQDKLMFTIQDNVTGVDAFDIIAYGIKI